MLTTLGCSQAKGTLHSHSNLTTVASSFGRIQFPLFDVSVRPLLTASSHGDATAPTIPCDDAVRHFPSRRCRVKFVVKGLLLNVVEGIEKFMLDTETSG